MKEGLQENKPSFRREAWRARLFQNSLAMASSTKCAPKPTVKKKPPFPPRPSHTMASPRLSLFFLFALFCFACLPPPSDYEHVGGMQPSRLLTGRRCWVLMKRWVSERASDWIMNGSPLQIARHYSLVCFLLQIMARQWWSLTRRTS